MKIKFLFITVFFVSSCLLLSAQSSYYRNQNGGIIDSIAYKLLRTKQIEKMHKAFNAGNNQVTIQDNFKLFKMTADSLIYSYQWAFTIKSSVANRTVFNPQDYIGKEFLLPILKSLNDKNISISDLKGKPTLLNFWFTTCPPCIEEMPVLNEIKAKLDQTVNFIAITYEEPKKVNAFLKKHKFSFTHIVNANALITSMKMKAFPINIFLDKNGIVKYIEGGIPFIVDDKGNMKMGDGKQFLKLLESLR